MSRLIETMQIASAFVPVNLATAANNGDWVSMANYRRCLVVLFKGAGGATENPVFTLQQATDNAGTSAKALNFTDYYTKIGTLTAVSQFTRVTQSAAGSATPASATSEAIIAAEINAAMLDVNGGFSHIQLSIPDVGATSQLAGGLYILFDPRYADDALVSVL
jgi:hypothetical protein